MALGPIGIEHSAVAFFGITLAPTAVEKLYESALTWFDRFLCEPHLMGTTYDKGSLIGFRRSASKLKRAGFNGIDGFQIDSLPPGAKNELEGIILEVIWCSRTRTVGMTVRTDIAAHTRNSLHQIASEISTICRPEYGIGFRRDENLQPGAYIIGSPRNLPRTPEGLREDFFIGGWGLWGPKCQVWQHGFLREVCYWNFLAPAQLRIAVNGVSLQTWIEERKDRGTLSPFVNELMLWEVPDAQITRVRSALMASRVIFDGSMYHRIYQESHDGRLVPQEEILRRLKDPTYVLQEAPPLQLSPDQVLRHVYGDAASEELRVLHVDKTGPQVEIREVPTEEILRIQEGENKKT